MDMPGFTAETSLYQTNNHYRSAGRSFLSNGNTTVTPQDCGITSGKFWGCLGWIGIGGIVCSGVCALGPLACAGCWTGIAGGAKYLECYECLPEWARDAIEGDGDGDGDPSCCPPGTTCRCGGHCIVGLCTGVCLPPGAPCPITQPQPRPIGCEVGEKCCERDADGNCELCIPRTASCNDFQS